MPADHTDCPPACDCERCRTRAANTREWNMDAVEHHHQHRVQEAYRDWVEDTYEPEP